MMMQRNLKKKEDLWNSFSKICNNMEKNGELEIEL